MTALETRVREASVGQLALDATTAVAQILEQRELRHADHLVQIELPDEGGDLRRHCQLPFRR